MFKVSTLVALVIAFTLCLTLPSTSMARPRHHHGHQHHGHQHHGHRHHGHRHGLHFGIFMGAPYWYLPPRPYRVYRRPEVIVVEPSPSTPLAAPVTPETSDTGTYRSTCREFTTTVTIGGEPQEAYGTACLQPDGTWKVVD